MALEIAKVGAGVVQGQLGYSLPGLLEKPLEGTKAGAVVSGALDISSGLLSGLSGKESRRQRRKREQDEAAAKKAQEAAKKAEAARKEAVRRWAATVELRERRLAEIAANGLPFDPSQPVAPGAVATQGGLVNLSAGLDMPTELENAGLIEPKVAVPGWWLPVGLGSIFVFVLFVTKKK